MLQKIDDTGRHAQLMSNYLNIASTTIDNDDHILEYKNGEYVKTDKPFICDFHVCHRKTDQLGLWKTICVE